MPDGEEETAPETTEAQPEPPHRGRPRGFVTQYLYERLEAGEWVCPQDVVQELGCADVSVYTALKRWRTRYGPLVESKDEHGKKRYRATPGGAPSDNLPATKKSQQGFLALPCTLPGVGSLLQVVGVVLMKESGATVILRDERGSNWSAEIVASSEGGS